MPGKISTGFPLQSSCLQFFFVSFHLFEVCHLCCGSRVRIEYPISSRQASINPLHFSELTESPGTDLGIYANNPRKTPGNIWATPGSTKKIPHAEPLYYDPEGIQGGIFNVSAKHFSFHGGRWIPNLKDPRNGAAYLPRGRPLHDLNHPAFGFMPVNYARPFDRPKPIHFSDPFRFLSSYEGKNSPIPFQIPFPLSEGGNHPIYAEKYFPGVRAGMTRFAYATPLATPAKFIHPSQFDNFDQRPLASGGMLPFSVPIVPIVPPLPPTIQNKASMMM